jgi:glycerol-3-phosphate dehydrogenase subunit C
MGNNKYRETPSHAALFAGCTINFIDPSIGLDSCAVLRHNAVEVSYPRQHCCGLPLRAYGYNKRLHEKAACNLKSLKEAGCDIIAPCTSCAYMLKEEYPSLLNELHGCDETECLATLDRTYDVMEYLAHLHEYGLLNTGFRTLDMRVIYHAPCHLKSLRNNLIDGRLRLLQMIPGLRLEWIDRGCCGMGGVFGMKKKNYSASISIGAELGRAINVLKPDLVITECHGCRMQIEHMTEVPGQQIRHPVSLLRLAYGL